MIRLRASQIVLAILFQSLINSVISLQIQPHKTVLIEESHEEKGFHFRVVEPPPGFEEWVSPVVLPSPIQDGSMGWADSLARAKKLVAQMTVEEKVNLTTGAGTDGRCVGVTGTVSRLGLDEPICLQDGPVGVRYTQKNSVFPAAINVAATFDKELIYKRGAALGNEFFLKRAHVALAPMTNLMRTPEGGRSWEGFGADPYLSVVATVQSVKGLQSSGVSACVKHFLNNEQEHYRGGSGSTASSSNVDDRTLHELYEWPFEEAVKAGVDYVMCSYNRINQTHACENSKLLNGYLKGEQEFQGVVVTDWAAAVSGVRTALAGTDMNMPGFVAYGDKTESNPAISQNSYWGAKLVDAVKNGSVPLERIDDMVTRIVSTYYRRGQDKPTFSDWRPGSSRQSLRNDTVDATSDHSSLIREIGAASTILLKNLNHTLPLMSPKSLKSIAILGEDAGHNPKGPNACKDRGCNDGTLAVGWGSGTADFPYLITPVDAITAFVKDGNNEIVVKSALNQNNTSEVEKALDGVDLAIVHVNSNSGEGYITVEGNMGDRNDLKLWHKGEELILKAADSCRNVVVVIHTVGAVEMESWIGHENIKAVLLAGLPGQESGNSEVDILWGRVNPSGRLPYTIAKDRSDYGAKLLYNSSDPVPQITYSEKLEIDYRYFDSNSIEPRFEYGFGLSYTNFQYMTLVVKSDILKSDKYEKVGLYETLVCVTFQIMNIGEYPGHEVPQLYLGFPESANEPPKVLRGFQRVYIPKGQKKEVELELRRRDISIWDVVSQSWVVPEGKFKVMIGSSSRKIHLVDEFEVDS
ncbi:beta glucosidase precursor [Phakopsora pachyrhizi]|nr:beta glucosidase precursor [Phakopsora pachyrhizi]